MYFLIYFAFIIYSCSKNKLTQIVSRSPQELNKYTRVEFWEDGLLPSKIISMLLTKKTLFLPLRLPLTRHGIVAVWRHREDSNIRLQCKRQFKRRKRNRDGEIEDLGKISICFGFCLWICLLRGKYSICF